MGGGGGARARRNVAAIVMFGGLAMLRPYPGSNTVSTVNGGVMGLMNTLIVELAPIRVNVIHPGIVGDSLRIGGTGDLSHVVARTPCEGRLAQMADIVDAVVDSCSATRPSTASASTSTAAPCWAGKPLEGHADRDAEFVRRAGRDGSDRHGADVRALRRQRRYVQGQVGAHDRVRAESAVRRRRGRASPRWCQGPGSREPPGRRASRRPAEIRRRSGPSRAGCPRWTSRPRCRKPKRRVRGLARHRPARVVVAGIPVTVTSWSVPVAVDPDTVRVSTAVPGDTVRMKEPDCGTASVTGSDPAAVVPAG